MTIRAHLSTFIDEETDRRSLRLNVLDHGEDETAAPIELASADVLTEADGNESYTLTDLMVKVADVLGEHGYRVIGTGWKAGMDYFGLWLMREVTPR